MAQNSPHAWFAFERLRRSRSRLWRLLLSLPLSAALVASMTVLVGSALLEGLVMRAEASLVSVQIQDRDPWSGRLNPASDLKTLHLKVSSEDPAVSPKFLSRGLRDFQLHLEAWIRAEQLRRERQVSSWRRESQALELDEAIFAALPGSLMPEALRDKGIFLEYALDRKLGLTPERLLELRLVCEQQELDPKLHEWVAKQLIGVCLSSDIEFAYLHALYQQVYTLPLVMSMRQRLHMFATQRQGADQALQGLQALAFHFAFTLPSVARLPGWGRQAWGWTSQTKKQAQASRVAQQTKAWLNKQAWVGKFGLIGLGQARSQFLQRFSTVRLWAAGVYKKVAPLAARSVGPLDFAKTVGFLGVTLSQSEHTRHWLRVLMSEAIADDENISRSEWERINEAIVHRSSWNGRRQQKEHLETLDTLKDHPDFIEMAGFFRTPFVYSYLAKPLNRFSFQDLDESVAYADQDLLDTLLWGSEEQQRWAFDLLLQTDISEPLFESFLTEEEKRQLYAPPEKTNGADHQGGDVGGQSSERDRQSNEVAEQAEGVEQAEEVDVFTLRRQADERRMAAVRRQIEAWVTGSRLLGELFAMAMAVRSYEPLQLFIVRDEGRFTEFRQDQIPGAGVIRYPESAPSEFWQLFHLVEGLWFSLKPNGPLSAIGTYRHQEVFLRAEAGEQTLLTYLTLRVAQQLDLPILQQKGFTWTSLKAWHGKELTLADLLERRRIQSIQQHLPEHPLSLQLGPILNEVRAMRAGQFEQFSSASSPVPKSKRKQRVKLQDAKSETPLPEETKDVP